MAEQDDDKPLSTDPWTDTMIEAVFAKYMPTHADSRLLLMCLIEAQGRLRVPPPDGTAERRGVRWEWLIGCAHNVVVLFDQAIAERDEARQQLLEAREQLHKIGRKAFWAGKA